MLEASRILWILCISWLIDIYYMSYIALCVEVLVGHIADVAKGRGCSELAMFVCLDGGVSQIQNRTEVWNVFLPYHNHLHHLLPL
jgi:hypothetical protein